MKKNWTTWYEIPVKDFDRAKKFYEAIFEVELHVEDFGNFKMGIFPHEKVGCAIVWGESYEPSEQGSLVYMDANPDLKEVENRIAGAGGNVVIEKRMISPDHGNMAVFIDPEGNRLALHSDN